MTNKERYFIVEKKSYVDMKTLSIKNRYDFYNTFGTAMAQSNGISNMTSPVIIGIPYIKQNEG